MAEYNEIEDIVVPDSPKVLSGEQNHIYVPIATYDQNGIARFDSRYFEVIDGKVMMRMSMFTDKANLVNGTVPVYELPIVTSENVGIAKFDAEYFVVTDGKVSFDKALLDKKASLEDGEVPVRELPIATVDKVGIARFDAEYFTAENGFVSFNKSILDAKADLVDGKVPEEELPEASDSKKGIASYDSNDFVVSNGVVQISRDLLNSFSDVIYSSSLTNLPNTGRVNALYIVGNLLYRWNGNSYVKMITESTGGGSTGDSNTGGNTGSTEGGFVLDANNNLVFGENNTFNGDAHNCVVIGSDHDLSAWMGYGLIVGRGHKAEMYNPDGCVLLGEYAKVAEYTRFAIGTGSSPNDRRNAIEVTSEGRVYINDVYVGGAEDSPGDSVEEPHLVFSGIIYINNTVNGVRLEDKPYIVQINNPVDNESGAVLISNIFTKNTFELFGHKMSLQYEDLDYYGETIHVIYFNVPDLEYSDIQVNKIYELW